VVHWTLRAGPAGRAVEAEATDTVGLHVDARGRLRVRGTVGARRSAQRVRVLVRRALGAGPDRRAVEPQATEAVCVRVAAREGL